MVIRICNLKKGERFYKSGVQYRVSSITDKTISYTSINKRGSGGTTNIVGRNSNERVNVSDNQVYQGIIGRTIPMWKKLLIRRWARHHTLVSTAGKFGVSVTTVWKIRRGVL